MMMESIEASLLEEIEKIRRKMGFFDLSNATIFVQGD